MLKPRKQWLLALITIFVMAFNLCAAPLKVAYSDWPGWVAWEIAIQKDWFKQAGVDVEFKWFEYVPSMDAFAAGQVDAVCMTNGDALVTGSTGAPSVAILMNDYSNGNDMVVAKPGIKSVKQLKGKKVGVEVGFVSHLLLLHALKSAGLTEDDITVVNMPTDQTPQALGGGTVDAIVAWQPNSGQAINALPGSKAVFTSADVKGIIYDVLAVNPKSLAENKADWEKIVAVWYKIADYMADPSNEAEMLKIMSARVGLTPAEYKPLLSGTYILGEKGNKKHFKKSDSLKSIYGSNIEADKFNVKYEVYGKSLDTESYLDPSFVK
jgi:NitT/TauT family transport system substrate-binding protein